MFETLEHQGRILAIIVKSEFHEQGIRFFTTNDFSQQLGYMNRPRGYVIPPHVHNSVQRQIHSTGEVLLIKSGRLRADFYDNDSNYLLSRILERGDILLLASGGHGFEMLEPTEIFEVKQGPYIADSDKRRFKEIAPDRIVF